MKSSKIVHFNTILCYPVSVIFIQYIVIHFLELWNVVNQLGEQLCEIDMSILSEKSRNKLLKVASKIVR